MKRWTEMADRFRAAGLNVKEYDGWETRGDPFAPIAVMAHHTAPPVPFPLANLAGVTSGNIKCNVNIKPDGTVWCVAAGRANYSAGRGDARVLEEVRQGIPPAARAKDRNYLNQDAGGSAHFFGIEVDHLGDGSDIPEVELDALHRVCAVLLDMLDESNANRLITHAEWTYRKIDPYWNQTRNTGPSLRTAVNALMLTPPTTPPEDDDMLSKYLTAETWGVLYDAGVVQGASRDEVIDYWTDPARGDDEHLHATNVIVRQLAVLFPQHGHKATTTVV